MARHKVADGFEITRDKSDKNIACEPCLLAKARRNKIPKHRIRMDDDTVAHADKIGPIPWSGTGNRYVLFIGNRGKVKSYPVKKKSDSYAKIKEYFAEIDRQFGKQYIKTFRGDNEFKNNNMLKNFFKSNGIRSEFTTRDNPFQNGKAERFHQSIMNMARAMLISSQLSSKSDRNQSSGYERTENRKPDLRLIRPFGEICFYRDPTVSGKLAARGIKVKFLGIAEQHKGYILYEIQNHKVVYSRDVRFVPSGTILTDEIFLPDNTDTTPAISPTPNKNTKPESPRRSTRATKMPKRLIEEVNLVYSDELNGQMDEPIRSMEIQIQRSMDKSDGYRTQCFNQQRNMDTSA
jgi:hypothetical protein